MVRKSDRNSSNAVLAKFDYIISDMKEVEKELIEQESDAKSKEDKLPLGTHNLCILLWVHRKHKFATNQSKGNYFS